MMLVSKVALRHMIAIQVPLVLCSKRLAIKLMLFVCPESIEAEKRTNRWVYPVVCLIFHSLSSSSSGRLLVRCAPFDGSRSLASKSWVTTAVSGRSAQRCFVCFVTLRLSFNESVGKSTLDLKQWKLLKMWPSGSIAQLKPWNLTQA